MQHDAAGAAADLGATLAPFPCPHLSRSTVAARLMRGVRPAGQCLGHLFRTVNHRTLYNPLSLDLNVREEREMYVCDFGQTQPQTYTALPV